MENIVNPPKIGSLSFSLTVCPCCGHKFKGSLKDGCTACEAKAVGEPLARPEKELPSFGRSLFVGTIGAVLLLVFFISTFIAHLERPAFDLNFWSIVSSAEIAAWRLKWMAIPFSILSIWIELKICASIRRDSKKFMWSKFAHTGLAASVLFVLMIGTLIGVTIPERLRLRQRGFEAGQRAKVFMIDKVLFDYRIQYGTLPAVPSDLKKLQDTDGSVALAMEYLEQNSIYKPSSEIAEVNQIPKKAPIGKPVASTETIPTTTVSFTNYEVRIAGEDGIFGNEDDLIIRDGIISKPEPKEVPQKLERVDEK